jgi:hypothetical protein
MGQEQPWLSTLAPKRMANECDDCTEQDAPVLGTSERGKHGQLQARQAVAEEQRKAYRGYVRHCRTRSRNDRW